MRLVLKRRIKANLTNFSDEQSQARLSYAMKRSKSAKLINANNIFIHAKSLFSGESEVEGFEVGFNHCLTFAGEDSLDGAA